MDEAYGGIIFDDAGRVLLREPRNHFGNCTWTFPKGRQSNLETPRETAERETREGTGLFTRVVGEVPGEYRGTVTLTRYFLMELTGKYQPPDDETWSIRWANPEEARGLIAESKDSTVRDRDLAVLKAALNTRSQLQR